MTTNSSFIKEKDRGEDFHVALLFLWIYSAYMLIKHIKLLQAAQTLDPRLSYANQMEAVFDKPKAFLRGCIGLTGSTVSIHQNGRSPAGPVLYVHPKLGLSELAVFAWTP